MVFQNVYYVNISCFISFCLILESKEFSNHIVVQYLFKMAILHIFKNLVLHRFKSTATVVILSFTTKTFRLKLYTLWHIIVRMTGYGLLDSKISSLTLR